MRKVEFGEIATFSQGQQVSIPDQKTEKFETTRSPCPRVISISRAAADSIQQLKKGLLGPVRH